MTGTQAGRRLAPLLWMADGLMEVESQKVVESSGQLGWRRQIVNEIARNGIRETIKKQHALTTASRVSIHHSNHRVMTS